jgi:FAD/FMN-containing dehydrogenase
MTGEFGGSISAEHGIGILKRPYLKMSRTEAEIETMRTLKRALDPQNILNPGRIFTVWSSAQRKPHWKTRLAKGKACGDAI